MCSAEKRKKLAAILKGNDAMKISSMKKSKRIALISVAAAMLAVCSPVSAFATGQSQQAKVIYTGNGSTATVAVENADNLTAFRGLMPNGTTAPQEIVVQNNSSKQMMVYFQALPANAEGQAAPTQAVMDLLNELDLKITFKLDASSPEMTLYNGKASGKTPDTVNPGTQKDITTAQIPLGYVYENSTSGALTATLHAPETMDNAFADASAAIRWVFQFQLADPTHNGGGGGGGGGGANAPGGAVISSLPPVESIAPESIPQGGPASSSPTSSPESIPNESVPLSKPPKTGETPVYLWIVLVAALAACAVFVAARGKTKSSGKNR